MVERAGGPGLCFEAPDALRVCGARSRQRLDRDVAAQTRIVGAVHLAHASGADHVVDFVRAEPCSPRERFAHVACSLRFFGNALGLTQRFFPKEPQSAPRMGVRCLREPEHQAVLHEQPGHAIDEERRRYQRYAYQPARTPIAGGTINVAAWKSLMPKSDHPL